MAMLNWLDGLLFGIRTLLEAGVEKPLRSVVNLIGATVVDNPTEGRLDVTISGTGNLAKLTLLDQPTAPALTLGATVLGSSAGVLSIVSPLGPRRTFEAGGGVATTRHVSEVLGSPVRTTNNTPTTLLTIPIPTMSIISCEVEILGLKSDGSAGAWELMSFRAVRGMDSPSGPGGTTFIANDDDIGGYSKSVLPTASAIVLTIIGPAATTVDWMATARVTTFTP